jgi:PAS domain-containing protein
MDESEQVSELASDIYDAALDRSLWPEALERTCGFVEGITCALLVQDSIAQSGQFHSSWGFSPEDERLYLDKYIRLNPAILPTIINAKIGDVLSTATVMPYDEFLASRFYREWAQPRGYCDAVWAVLEKSATAAAAVSVIRADRQGLADDAARRRLRLLTPHFRRSVAIGKLIDLRSFEAAAFADSLDGLAAAMILVDGNGRIMHTNPAGRRMLDEGTVLRALGGRVTAGDPLIDGTLHEIFMNAENGDAADGTESVSVPIRTAGGANWIAHVLPLTSGARRKAGAHYSAVAAVLVHEAALDLPHPIETIAGLYKLTPAETRILMAIVEIGGVPEVAPVLGIADTTVKLVAGYMSPLGR